MLPLQAILLIVMLPLLLIFGSGLLGMIMPRRARPAPPPPEDEEEIKPEAEA